ncbi:MAG: cytochrome P450 [Sciscionella sp.]
MDLNIADAECPHLRQYSLVPPAERPLDEPAYFGELREECPISQVGVGPEHVAWLFTQYGDVKTILSDTRFSSSPVTPGFPLHGVPGSDNPVAVSTMIRSDPPEHLRLRRMITKDFNPRAVEGYRDFVTATIDARIDALATLPQPLDFVESFALAVPSRVIARILGVPLEEEDRFHELTERLTTLSLTREEQYAVVDEFTEFCNEIVKLKEANPADDLVTRLTHEQLHTGQLTKEQLAGFIHMLVSAGHDTTAGMFGLSVLTLLKFPEQLAMLKSGEREWENAVEELVRIHTVVRMGPRRAATEDIEVGGQLVRKGQGVIASILAANHDEDTFGPSGFADFSIPEERPKHLGFGFGPHQCIGQTLARLELNYGLPRLFERYPKMRLADENLTSLGYREGRAFFGLRELSICL